MTLRQGVSRARVTAWTHVARADARILKRDLFAFVVLVAMPFVVMAFFSPLLDNYQAPRASAVEVVQGQQAVLGITSVFGMFVVGFVGFAYYREFEWGTWRRLRTTVGRLQLLVGKSLVPLIVCAMQQMLLLLAGHLFLTDRSIDLPLSLVVAVAYGAALTALGTLVVTVTRTLEQQNAMAQLGALVLGGIGGGLVPLSALAPWLQALAPASPTYWALRGYVGAAESDAASALSSAAVLLLLALPCGMFAWHRLPELDRRA